MAKKRYFIILIGGPGTFEPCDSKHDQVWSNYVVPIQLATKEHQLELSAGEEPWWWVYAPAYRERWADDVADVANPKLDAGRNLLQSRQGKLDAVRASGARDYLDRIEKFAGTVKARFKAIDSPADFWKQLAGLPAGSVRRLWYIGHASADGLMLKLIHTADGSCTPAANVGDMISIADIGYYSGVLSKVLAKDGAPSKFYGCHTQAFAEQWQKKFSVGAEGAISKIDFGAIDRPSKIKKILPRLEDSAGWRRFPAP